MRTEYFFSLPYITAIIFGIATLVNLKFLLAVSFILIGIINVALLIYLGASLLAHYGLYTSGVPEEISDDDIGESYQMLQNPIRPQIFNIGLFTIFAISMTHLGSPIATASFIMLGLYFITFQSNKMLIEKMIDLTL